MRKSYFFSDVHKARVVTLKDKGSSQGRISVRIGCSKPVAHTALSYFTNLEIYWDKEGTGRRV